MPDNSHDKAEDHGNGIKSNAEHDEEYSLSGLDEFTLGDGLVQKEKLVCHMREPKAKIVFGVIIVLLIALSWVGATQFANKTYTPDFSAPYFTTWYTTAFMVVVFPWFSIPQLFKKRPWRFKSFYRESAVIFGSQGICLVSLLKYTLPFCILWLTSNYCYIRALKALNPADVTAVFSSVSAFVYIFSMIFLKEKFFITRTTAVLLSIGGLVLFASRYGFKGANVIGIVLTVFAAVASALYQVLFKRVVGNATGSQVALFLSLLALCDILICWVMILPMHFTGYELIHWSKMPWKFLNGSGILVLVFNYLVNFGIAFTSPLFIALGTVLGIPLNAVADFIFNNTSFGIYQIVAAVLILLGFLLMLIPNETLLQFEKKLLCFKDNPDSQNEEISEEGMLEQIN